MRRTTMILAMLAGLLTSALHAADSGTAIKEEKLLAGPSASAKPVGVLAKGEAVTILASDKGWMQVKGRTGQGWVRLLSIRKGASGGGSGSAADLVALTQGRAGSGQVVATAGVRGLDEEDLRAAKFDARELERLEGFAVSQSQAESFAKKSQLVARPVAFLPDPAAKARESQGGSGFGPGWGE